ncbi:hypothetical protein V492_05997 [Pseudogymnoascus sp. VKM F-4246]|nr:hypothetical protein V492_05997 [Pseudogymnoascus sp. VKM F-4246]
MCALDELAQGCIALQRTAYPYNGHEPIAPNNFYDINPQARYAAPLNFYDNNAQAGYAAPRNFNNNNVQAGYAALHNFHDNNAQAGYAAPWNSLQIQIAPNGEPGAALGIAAIAPPGHLLSSSVTKKVRLCFNEVDTTEYEREALNHPSL